MKWVRGDANEYCSVVLLFCCLLSANVCLFLFFSFSFLLFPPVLANPRKCPITDLSPGASAQLAAMKVGTAVFVFELPHSEHIAAAAARKVVVVHRGEKLLNIMVRKVDAESLLFTVRTILGKDTNPPIVVAAPAAPPAPAAPAAPAAVVAEISKGSI